MCRSCQGRCLKCRRRLHNNYVMLVLTGGMWIIVSFIGTFLPKKHSGPCSNA